MAKQTFVVFECLRCHAQQFACVNDPLVIAQNHMSIKAYYKDIRMEMGIVEKPDLRECLCLADVEPAMTGLEVVS